MKKRLIISMALIALVLVCFKGSAHADGPFTRTLSIGSTGSDVLMLQQFLNKDPRTQLASTGPGSPGQETSYYGNLTLGAVTKFQNLYGVTTGTPGSVDIATLNFINALEFSTDPTVATATSTISQDQLNAAFQFGADPSLPYISVITPKAIVNGDTVVIQGKNFSTSSPNIIRLSYNAISASSTDGVTLSVVVDSQLNTILNQEMKNMSSDDKDKVKKQIPPIPLFVTVQNENGVSNPYELFVAFSKESLESGGSAALGGGFSPGTNLPKYAQ